MGSLKALTCELVRKKLGRRIYCSLGNKLLTINIALVKTIATAIAITLMPGGTIYELTNVDNAINIVPGEHIYLTRRPGVLPFFFQLNNNLN